MFVCVHEHVCIHDSILAAIELTFPSFHLELISSILTLTSHCFLLLPSRLPMHSCSAVCRALSAELEPSCTGVHPPLWQQAPSSSGAQVRGSGSQFQEKGVQLLGIGLFDKYLIVLLFPHFPILPFPQLPSFSSFASPPSLSTFPILLPSPPSPSSFTPSPPPFISLGSLPYPHRGCRV